MEKNKNLYFMKLTTTIKCHLLIGVPYSYYYITLCIYLGFRKLNEGLHTLNLPSHLILSYQWIQRRRGLLSSLARRVEIYDNAHVRTFIEDFEANERRTTDRQDADALF